MEVKEVAASTFAMSKRKALAGRLLERPMLERKMPARALAWVWRHSIFTSCGPLSPGLGGVSKRDRLSPAHGAWESMPPYTHPRRCSLRLLTPAQPNPRAQKSSRLRLRRERRPTVLLSVRCAQQSTRATTRARAFDALSGQPVPRFVVMRRSKATPGKWPAVARL